jgi:CRP-like cAMP-binding protein
MFRRSCNMARVRLLKSFPLFSTCSIRHLGRVDSLTSDVRVEAGRVLTQIGQPGYEFFIVMSGTATVWCHGAVLERLGPGSYFGELALLYRRDRAATVVADTDMDLLVMSIQEFRSPHFLTGPVKGAIFATVEERLCRTNEAWASPGESAMRSDLPRLPTSAAADLGAAMTHSR